MKIVGYFSTPLYKVKISGILFKHSELTNEVSSDIFPTLTDPTSGTASVLDITADVGQKLEIKWTNPAGFTPKKVVLSWDGTHDTPNDCSRDATSATLESTTDTNIRHGEIRIEGIDGSNRRIRAEWRFFPLQ